VLSFKVAQNAAESIVYTPVSEDGFTNRVDVAVR